MVFRERELVLSGERRARRTGAGSTFLCLERPHGRFERAVPLDVPVDVARARATLAGGILTVTLPRLRDRRGRETVVPIEREPPAMTEEPKDEDQPKIPEVLPVLPLRDIVIFPFMIVPLYVSRDRSIKAVDQALAENRMILLAAQKKQDEDDPGPDDIFPWAPPPSSCGC